MGNQAVPQIFLACHTTLLYAYCDRKIYKFFSQPIGCGQNNDLYIVAEQALDAPALVGWQPMAPLFANASLCQCIGLPALGAVY